MTLSLECMPEVKARRLTDELRQSLTISWELLTEAYTGRVWLSLGYESWNAYMTAELGEVRLRLPRDERQQVVASLTEAGLSTRAIGAALGVDAMTVSRDRRAGVAEAAPGERDEPIDAEIVDAAPRPVLGTDGKTYTVTSKPERNLAIPQAPRYGPRRKHLQVLEAVTTSLSGLVIAVDDITELDPSVTPDQAAQLVRDLDQQARSLNQIRHLLKERVPDNPPEPEPADSEIADDPWSEPPPLHGERDDIPLPPLRVVSTDGKSYPAAGAIRPTRRRPITDTAMTLAFELQKVADKVDRFRYDDRLTANREKVSLRLRSQLQYAAEMCNELIEALEA